MTNEPCLQRNSNYLRVIISPRRVASLSAMRPENTVIRICAPLTAPLMLCHPRLLRSHNSADYVSRLRMMERISELERPPSMLIIQRDMAAGWGSSRGGASLTWPGLDYSPSSKHSDALDVFCEFIDTALVAVDPFRLLSTTADA